MFFYKKIRALPGHWAYWFRPLWQYDIVKKYLRFGTLYVKKSYGKKISADKHEYYILISILYNFLESSLWSYVKYPGYRVFYCGFCSYCESLCIKGYPLGASSKLYSVSTIWWKAVTIPLRITPNDPHYKDIFVSFQRVGTSSIVPLIVSEYVLNGYSYCVIKNIALLLFPLVVPSFINPFLNLF